MNGFNLRDYFLNDRPGEELGQRAEAVISMGLGFFATLAAILAFQNPVAMVSNIIANLVSLFTLIQAVRGKFNYLILFPVVTAISICIVSIYDGKGSHDLVWAGTLGLYLLAHIYSRKNMVTPVVLGVVMIGLFVGTSLAEMNGLLPNRYGTDVEHLLLGVLYLSVIMGALTAVFHRHRSLLNIAMQSREEENQTKRLLESLNSQLDQQVRTRTAELEEVNRELMVKTARLQAASEISQELARAISAAPAELLSLATRLISEKLGYYHVGIFIVDAVRGFAVLQAANSRGGQEMLAKRHQLKVGGAGIVGYVSQSGRPRIALDTGADAVFFNNPYLPETRSEISLPIKFGNAVIGVLDVQSTQPAAFSEEDTNTLMTIANQLAMILQQHEDRPSTFAVKGGRRSANAGVWEQQVGYSFRSDGSISSEVALEANPTVEKVIATGEVVAISRSSADSAPTLAVPVKFREQVIGIIHIEAEERIRNWTEDEILLVQSISDRAALALENARLFEDATRRAEQEETISRVTTQIGASTDFERIMQTTIQELGLALGASRSFIQITTPASTPDEEKVSE